MRPFPARRGHGEDGSILPMTALTVVIVMVIAAFCVDIGVQRVATRDMQAVADAVALDTARDPSLSSCNTGALTSKANTSLARQTRRIGSSKNLVVTPGRVDAAGTFSAATASCNAVKITSATTVGFSFAQVIGVGSGDASRAAVGTRSQPAICFSAGTRALTLNTSGTALSPLLDKILKTNLGVGGYTGLVDLKNLSVPLADLATALNVGSAQELVTANVTLQKFLVAAATVLRQQGKLTEAQLLESIGTQVSTPAFSLGKLLAIGSSGDTALNAEVNALDLVGTAIVQAAIANGKNAVALGADLGLPLNLLNASSRLVILEAPQIACGTTGATAKTAQIRIDLKTGIDVLGPLKAADIDLGVQVARGSATLGATTCGSAATATVTGQTAAAGVTGYGGTGMARLNVASLLGLIELPVDLTGSVASSTASYTFTYPAAPGLPSTHTFGSPVNLQLDISPSSLLGTLLSPVAKLLTTVLNPLLEGLLTPLLGLLGVRLGTMDVTMLGRPNCNAVRLAG